MSNPANSQKPEFPPVQMVPTPDQHSVRRAYSKPQVRELGDVESLTAGDAGANPDFGTSMFG